MEIERLRRSKRLNSMKKKIKRINNVVVDTKKIESTEFFHTQQSRSDEENVVVGRIHTKDKENYLEYVLDNKDNVMDMIHTFVSPSRRGQKLAFRITSTAFELAVSRGWRVRPSCTYISKTFLPRSNGKWTSHIASLWEYIIYLCVCVLLWSIVKLLIHLHMK